MRGVSLLVALAMIPFTRVAQAAPKNPVVVITTNLGVIKAEIDVAGAPATAANFLQYVDEKFYDGTIFNRVIADFVVQGGGYTPELSLKRPRAPIKNEAAKKRKNAAGTLAMAHLDDPDSATSHFFINVAGNQDLDYVDAAHPGYCVFGKVIAGMEVVRKIARVPTDTQKGLPDVPKTPVLIQSIRRQ